MGASHGSSATNPSNPPDTSSPRSKLKPAIPASTPSTPATPSTASLASTARRVLAGDFSRASLLAFLFIVLGTITVLLVVAWILYDQHDPGEPYDILVNQISHLGDPGHNPVGCYFFSIALWTFSFAAVPLLRFYRHVLPPLQAKVTGVFTVFFALGIPGTALVGFFPSALSKVVHVIAAGFAFGGIGLAYFFAGIGFITSKLRGHDPRIPPALVIASAAFIAFVIAGFAVVGYTAAAGIFDDVEGTWLSFSLWEWLLLIAICAMTAAISIPLVKGNPC
ncbi:MAG: hypothetical protein GYA24_12325 [Candidatus Lokiarchaeota archaeon]|nr:hypothetical protein [Candidatus Lokiarchaeota archaeon]